MLSKIQSLAILGCAVLGASFGAFAQQGSDVGLRIAVIIVDVKSGSAADFEAAAKDAAAAQQAAGRPFFHVYQRLRGDLPSFTVITADQAFNELPAIEPDPSLDDRIGHAINGVTLLTIETYNSLSIAGEGLAPGGEFLHTRVRTTSPANVADYVEWQAELRDVLQEAGVSDLRVGRVVFGANTSTFVRWSYSDTFPGTGPADGIDIAGTIGQRDFERLLQRGNDLTVAAEDYVLRFREDLSFTAEQ